VVKEAARSGPWVQDFRVQMHRGSRATPNSPTEADAPSRSVIVHPQPSKSAGTNASGRETLAA